MEIREILEKVKSGETSVAEAEEFLRDLPYEDLGFARLDHHRALRSGFGEVVYCEGKSAEQVRDIYCHFAGREGRVLGTRASAAQYEAVKAVLPEVVYDPVARILKLTGAAAAQTAGCGAGRTDGTGDIRGTGEAAKTAGCVAVLTGGTSDIPVAEEAAQTAEFFGAHTERIFDVGVAGIHRLLSVLPQIRRARCIVAVAGMEGALAGVTAGLVDCPVIAVPTSVGYGASFSGLAPLLTMLNSCAEGVATVNIDNGFGAGYLAAQINRQIEMARQG